MWDRVRIDEPTDRWAELDETGWDALIAWAAGPQNLRRVPGSDAGRIVSVTRTRGGVTEQFEEPFTQDDRRLVDDSVDEYLAEAGIPSRPRGYRWFIRVPDPYGSARAFHEIVHKAIIKAYVPTPVHPANWRAVIERVMADVYSLTT